jgi:hypothetical protein
MNYPRLYSPLLVLAAGALLVLPVRAQTNPSAAAAPQYRPYPVDVLVAAPTTQMTGNTAFQPRQATMNGVQYARSLVTEVNNNATATQQFSSMTIDIGGRFSRFQVTVGRDDALAARGPGYAVFEVWGDGRRLFRSYALRSAMTTVQTGPGGGTKSQVPQKIDISVRGIRSLRLLTRYALEFSQQARYVNRAMGCVWGNPMLIFAPDAPPELVITHAGVKMAVREAAERLAGSVSNSPRYKDPKSWPLRVGVTPLRVDPGPPADEPAVRALIAKELSAVRRGREQQVLTPLSQADHASLAAALPVGGSARLSGESVAAIGRGVKADFVALGALIQTAGRWQVQVRLIETKQGGLLEQVTVPVPDMTGGL